MTKDDFMKFVEENAINERVELDWKKERDIYLEYLSQLYKQINGFLKEFVDSKKINIRTETTQISEEYIGTYSAPTMIITIGAKIVSLTPIGTVLIATKGRVDMQGSNGTIKILLVDSKKRGLRDHIRVTIRQAGEPTPKGIPAVDQNPIEWQWRILTPPPSSKYLEFNADNFMDALMELSNG